MDHLGLKTPEEAWIYRTQLGVRGSYMAGQFAVFGTQAGAKVFADWTNRIASGELPPQPPRPQGVERNVVVTLWDWGDAKTYLHAGSGAAGQGGKAGALRRAGLW